MPLEKAEWDESSKHLATRAHVRKKGPIECDSPNCRIHDGVIEIDDEYVETLIIDWRQKLGIWREHIEHYADYELFYYLDNTSRRERNKNTAKSTS